MSVGDLLYTDTEEQLRASVRDLLTDRAPWPAVLARTETAEPVDTDLWRRLAQLGGAGLAVPSAWGGVDASWREAAVVAEELGRAVAPVPFLGHAVATALLLELGAEDLLPAVAAGERTAAVVVRAATAAHENAASVDLQDGRLHGSVPAVLDATTADLLLVRAGDALYAVDAADARVTPAPSLDRTRPIADISFDGAPGTVVASGPAVDEALAKALQIGAVLLAAEQLGLAQRCLEIAVQYLQTRRQFGRLIGEFQALKHRAADVWVRNSGVRAAARYAADCAATDAADLPVAAALAQAAASPAAELAAQECLQLHGGIGFTWELPVHLYLKRAKSSAILLGTADRHRAAIGDLVGIPAVPTGGAAA
ncbi:acyl-CoA dehydrogenase family protein [Sporichthya polymorpha]|uniref:acyl-CoA dehydrogenase family protein n=1 Tax=Sporichthya polymorpha TaxID=35751 RepID=UPI0003746C4E|nr:acyl-CoA dehydrogenase family protein [Sporichthya polymorpha]